MAWRLHPSVIAPHIADQPFHLAFFIALGGAGKLVLERGSVIITSNLPFDEWTEIFGSERLTGALLDRLTHHVHILEMNGESYRLKQSQKRRNSPKTEPS